MKGLNPEQRQAIETTDGRVLVLAGAGSGKTRVLTERIAYLIEKKGVPPEAILGVTFTNKAAAEMRSRLAGLIDSRVAKKVVLATFHSFCMRVLRAEIERLGYTSSFSLYDEQDVQRLVKGIAHDLLEHEGSLPALSSVIETITQRKNEGGAVETGSDWHDQFAENLYQRLQVAMRAHNAVDFDDLLLLTLRLFQEHPDVLQAYQNRFSHIMIDEYQDTNPVQDRLAALLAGDKGNLCVVGDDDQSIYGWRGANVANIIEFRHEKRIMLEQNYRSTNTILQAANAVINHNKERHQKRMWSGKGEGDKIVFHTAPDEVQEAEWVVHRLAEMKREKNLAWSDFAIMYRSNALSRQFEIALAKYLWNDRGQLVRGIPHEVYGGTAFYARKEIKDIVSYLRVIANPRDSESVVRTINLPRRGVGEGTLDKLTAQCRKTGQTLWEALFSLPSQTPNRVRKGIEDYINIIETAKGHFASKPLDEAMLWLLDRLQFKQAIHDEVKSPQMRQYKWENVQELVSSAQEFEKDREQVSLADFITATPLGEEQSQRKGKGPKSVVSLLTVHSAKGLEWPYCFLVGMEDHIMPHAKSFSIEEERRLLYVAITRAERYLVLTAARVRSRMGRPTPGQPSRFLYEIPKELLAISKS